MDGNKKSIADRIVDAMLAEVKKYGLELMERYPNDLMVHDLETLGRIAVPGAQLAWVCGDSHTHLVVLGVHEEQNSLIGAFLNMSSRDRFYRIKVGHSGFRMEELSRDVFAALERTPLQYRAVGQIKDGGVCLMRGNERIGAIGIESRGTFQDRWYQVTVQPDAGISAMDRGALDVWARRIPVEVAHTLFVRFNVEWVEPVRMAA
jgi:hypothetical protein